LVHKSLSMDFEEALDLAHVAQEQVRKTEDHKEAVQAFLEKRPANLKGRWAPGLFERQRRLIGEQGVGAPMSP
jgi:hypothetical protein